MNASLNAVTLFCEDVRAEAAGTETLVGIWPDNLNVPTIPFMIPKLGIYTRVTIGVDYPYRQLSVTMDIEGKKETTIGTADEALVSSSIRDARAKNSPITSIIMRAITSPFHIEKPGRVNIYLNAHEKRILTATLNIGLAPPSDRPSPPPS